MAYEKYPCYEAYQVSIYQKGQRPRSLILRGARRQQLNPHQF
uniref:Uncharacterized protein n=1 Tax=Rhizophora mucronata TaxID=61149 RepID=A0A2P2QZ11_RHIMU